MLSAHQRRRDTDDDGLSLIEVIASIVVFGLAATGLATGLLYSKHSVRDTRLRIQAANLAARESEIVRNQFTASASGPATLGAIASVTNPDPLAGGTAGQPIVVDNTPFTVTRTSEWVPAGTGTSACDGGTAVTYPTLAVHVEVSWSNMGSTLPVVTNTILTPPKGTLNSTLGFVAVKVTGATGQGVPNMNVTLSGASGPFTRSTETDGCTVFAVTTMGSYSANVNSPGYVTSDGLTTVTKNTVVSAGGIQIVPFSYDRAATLQTTLQTLSGWNLPTSLPPVTIYNSGLPAPTYAKSYASAGVSSTLTNLWPYTSGYNVWSSSCLQGDPATAGGSRPAATPLTAGTSVAVPVPLAPLTVTVANASASTVNGVTVVATPVSGTGCATGENPLTLGVTDATGTLKTSLPQGSYTLSVTGKTPVTSWPQTPSSFRSYTAATTVAVTVN